MKTITGTLVPFLADLIGLGLYVGLASWLRTQFQDLRFANSLLMGGIFLLFGVGVYGLKKIRRAAPGRDAPFSFFLQKRPLAVLGVLMALFVTIATAYVVGFLDSVVALNREIMDEPSATIYLLLTPASWFGLALVYVLLLSSPTEATVAPDTGRGAVVLGLGLAAVNLLAVTSTVFFQVVWLRVGPAGTPALVAVLTFLLYLLLFGPPRLIALAKRPRPGVVLTFIPLLAYLAWVSVIGNQ